MFFAVIDQKEKDSLPEHETQLSSIRWHLSEGLSICGVVEVGGAMRLTVPLSYIIYKVNTRICMHAKFSIDFVRGIS